MRLRRSTTEEFLRRGKGLRLKPDRAQQSLYGASEARVILDNSDGALAWGHVSGELPPIIATPLSLRYCTFGQTSELSGGAPLHSVSASCALPVAPYRTHVQPVRPRRATLSQSRRFYRQVEFQSRPAIGIACRPQAAAVVLDYRAHNREAHSHS